MANQALIKGELGVHAQPMFKGDLIAKPMAAAMDNFVKADQKRAAANAKRAGDIEQKYLKFLNFSEGGVTDAVKLAGRDHIKGFADVFKNDGTTESEMKAEREVENTNHTYKRFLDQNTKYVELITGDKDGEIEVPQGGWYNDWATGDDLGAKYPPGVSRGSDPHAMNANLAIFGGDKDITAKYNIETGEMDFYDTDGTVFEHLSSEQSVSQSDLNKNIFRRNDDFGSMMSDEATRQGSKNMTGTSRYLDYNKHLKTKGQIVSAYYDEMIPGVPSVYDHLHSIDKEYHVAKVGKFGSYNPKFAKEEITKYYNQILANEQANYIKKQESEEKKKQLALEQKNKSKRTPSEKDMDILFKQAITDNVNGNFTGTYGSRSIKNVEWRKHKQFDTNDKYTFLYDKDTGAKVGEFNFEDNPEQKSHIYISGNNHFFFNANDPEDVKRFGLRMKQINL